MLHTYVLSDAQRFPQKAGFYQDRSPAYIKYIKSAISSLFFDMIPNSLFEEYGPTVWQAR